MRRFLLAFVLVCLVQAMNSKKKQGQIPGGAVESDQNEKDKNYDIALKYAQKNYHLVCSLDETWAWNRVISVQKQMVAGMVYYLDVEFENSQDSVVVYELELFVDFSGNTEFSSCQQREDNQDEQSDFTMDMDDWGDDWI